MSLFPTCYPDNSETINDPWWTTSEGGNQGGERMLDFWIMERLSPFYLALAIYLKISHIGEHLPFFLCVSNFSPSSSGMDQSLKFSFCESTNNLKCLDLHQDRSRSNHKYFEALFYTNLRKKKKKIVISRPAPTLLFSFSKDLFPFSTIKHVVLLSIRVPVCVYKPENPAMRQIEPWFFLFHLHLLDHTESGIEEHLRLSFFLHIVLQTTGFRH